MPWQTVRSLGEEAIAAIIKRVRLARSKRVDVTLEVVTIRQVDTRQYPWVSRQRRLHQEKQPPCTRCRRARRECVFGPSRYSTKGQKNRANTSEPEQAPCGNHAHHPSTAHA